MQTTSQRIESKQDTLKKLDPEREATLDELYVNAIAKLHEMGEATQENIENTTLIYEQGLDEALADHRRFFYRKWDEMDEADREMVYDYIQPEYKDWLDAREERRNIEATI